MTIKNLKSKIPKDRKIQESTEYYVCHFPLNKYFLFVNWLLCHTVYSDFTSGRFLSRRKIPSFEERTRSVWNQLQPNVDFKTASVEYTLNLTGYSRQLWIEKRKMKRCLEEIFQINGTVHSLANFRYGCENTSLQSYEF